MDAAPENRVVAFCRDAPAPTVVRAHLRVGRRVGDVTVDVDEVYGPPAPTSHIAARFASLEDDETLLVSLASDGRVIGSGWPVYKETVSLELGIPDMHEAEAASLLMSPSCSDGLRALRDRGIHPARVEPASTRGCASCAASSSAPLDAAGAAILVAAVVVLRMSARRRARRG